MLEPEPALSEIDLAGDPGLDHPLEGPVNGSPADPLIFTANQLDELVGCEVTFLPEKDVDDEVALAGALAACRPQAVYVGRGGIHPGSCARRTGRRARWPVTP